MLLVVGVEGGMLAVMGGAGGGEVGEGWLSGGSRRLQSAPVTPERSRPLRPPTLSLHVATASS